MKKLFTFAAMLFAAMSINAQDPIPVTCAEAAAKMPGQHGSETEEVYIVTGYVTNTNGTVNSSNQQSFYIDDTKGSKKTFQGYLCTLPEGEGALNVGDKVTVTGKIKNYKNNPEIEKGTVAILERATVNIETYEVTVCEALEEGNSLNEGDYTNDIFKVYGRLKGVDEANTSGQHTFEMACGDQILKPFRCQGAEGLELGKGDSVVVTGKLYNYFGTIEISYGTVELIEKSGQVEEILKISVSEALAIIDALEKGAKTDARYAVTGFVTEIETAYDESFGNVSFYMADDAASTEKNFLAYRVKVNKEDATKVVAGAKVTVTSILQHYYKAAETEEEQDKDIAETVAGGTIEFAVESAVPTVTNETKTIKRIENGQVIFIRNGVRFNVLGTEVR